jgi:hypothetical protein
MQKQYWHFYVKNYVFIAKIIDVLLNKGETMILQIFRASKLTVDRGTMLLLYHGLQVRAAVLNPGYIS